MSFASAHVLTFSDASRTTAGILLITIVGIAYGGTFMLRVVAGKVPVNDFQKTYFRAGHAGHSLQMAFYALAPMYLVAALLFLWLARLIKASTSQGGAQPRL